MLKLYDRISSWFDFDLNIFLLQQKAIGIGHNFENLDRPLLNFFMSLHIPSITFEMLNIFSPEHTNFKYIFCKRGQYYCVIILICLLFRVITVKF